MFNLPNILTLSRGISALGVICMLAVQGPNFYRYLLVIFIFAACTDYADGALARKMKIVSDFGKVFDPLFDKVLVFVFLIILYPHGVVPQTIILLLIIRDLVIDALRSFFSTRGVVIPAIFTAKAKTVVTFMLITSALLELSVSSPPSGLDDVTMILAWLALGLSLISAMQYGAIFAKAYKTTP